MIQRFTLICVMFLNASAINLIFRKTVLFFSHWYYNLLFLCTAHVILKQAWTLRLQTHDWFCVFKLLGLNQHCVRQIIWIGISSHSLYKTSEQNIWGHSRQNIIALVKFRIFTWFWIVWCIQYSLISCLNISGSV